MTALVSVLNKRGAAIAADSAMTVSGNGTSKIYDNEQKIFQLSDANPVGIMICNNLSFLSTPLSLIFDLYRNERGDKKFPSLTDYVEDFIHYLKSLTQLQDKDVKDLYYQKEFNELIKFLKSSFEDKYDQITQDNPDIDGEEASRKCYEYVFDYLKDLVFEEEINPRLKNFSKDDFQKEVIESNKDFFTEYRELFPRMTNDEWELLLDIFYRDLINNTIGVPQGSELIFVGFGTDEIFPGTQRVFLSGMVGDEIKYDIEEISKISHNNSAEIRPFAQTDVMLTLIKGISPKLDLEYREATSELEKNIVNDILLMLEKEKVSPKIIKKVRDSSHDKTREAFEDRIEYFIHENFTEGVVSALDFFNQEEMAKMAENLIAVTNLQRHISSAEESVGGPIEVALLTKTGGFKWLKHNNI